LNAATPPVSAGNPPAGRLLCVSDLYGRQINFQYDAKGRVVKLSNPASEIYAYEYDGATCGCVSGSPRAARNANNLTMVTYPDSQTRQYHYNEASKLTQCWGNDSIGSGLAHLPNHMTGNRSSRGAGAATDLTTVINASNRISQVAGSATRSFTYDNNDSTTADGNSTYAYDPRRRMISATNGAGTTTYQVSSQGQRVRKIGTSGDTVFHYDAQGKLIAETTTAGAVKKEYLYLLDIPIAVNIQQ